MGPETLRTGSECAPPEKTVVRAGTFRYSAIQLLVALALLFFSAPFVGNLRGAELVEPVLLTLVMVFAVLAVGGRRRSLVIALLLVAPALGGKWLNHVRPDSTSQLIFTTATILFFGF